MRYSLLGTLWLLTGCAGAVAMEQHGGAAPIPSKVSDPAWVGLGAGLDAGLQVAKVAAVPRLLGDALAAYAVRNVSTYGRSADSGFLMVYGASLSSLTGFVVHALRHPSRACQVQRQVGDS